jgi:hypothetical protein
MDRESGKLPKPLLIGVRVGLLSRQTRLVMGRHARERQHEVFENVPS